MPHSTITDPESRDRASWSGLLAQLKQQGRADTDPDVVEARAALAYFRLSKAVAKERGQLSPAGADRLRAQLSEAVAS